MSKVKSKYEKFREKIEELAKIDTAIYVVVEDDGRIVGCGALHLYGPHLAEVRSIAVIPDAKGNGAGRSLVEALLEQAELQEVTCVCLFTRIPEFFSRMGFEVAVKEAIPDKLYKDCLRCPRFHNCDEVAMVRGELPGFAILQPPAWADGGDLNYPFGTDSLGRCVLSRLIFGARTAMLVALFASLGAMITKFGTQRR